MSETDKLAEPVGYAPAPQAATVPPVAAQFVTTDTQTVQLEVPLTDISILESLAQRLGWRKIEDETDYIMSSPAMVERIKQAEKDIRDGKGSKIKLEDLWN